MRARSWGVQLDVDGFKVLLQIFAALGSRDRCDVVTLRQHPGKSELRGGAIFLARNLLDLLHQVKVLLEVFSLKAGLWRRK